MTQLLQASERVKHIAFGGQLRAWRLARGQSQLALALGAGVSTRHLSYLETGRAYPSREMVMMLARTLEIPLRGRNRLLAAAGFAPLYRETPMDAPAMGPVREAIQFILSATEPNPTFVVNRRYDILDANLTGQWILSTFTADLSSFSKPYNMAQLLIRPQGMHAADHKTEGRCPSAPAKSSLFRRGRR